jgi:hypothetical protein
LIRSWFSMVVILTGSQICSLRLLTRAPLAGAYI